MTTLQDCQRKLQLQKLTLSDAELDALISRMYTSLPDQPCVAVLCWVHQRPPAGVPVTRHGKQKTRRRGKHPEWQSLLPANYDAPPAPPKPGAEPRLQPAAAERLPLPPVGDFAGWQKYRGLFLKYETVGSRNVEGAELSRLMLGNQEAYSCLTRHRMFLHSQHMVTYVMETHVRAVQRVPDTFGNTVARLFGHGPPECEIFEYRLILDWVLTKEHRDAELHAMNLKKLVARQPSLRLGRPTPDADEATSQTLSRARRESTSSSSSSSSDAVPPPVKTATPRGHVRASSSHEVPVRTTTHTVPSILKYQHAATRSASSSRSHSRRSVLEKSSNAHTTTASH